MCANDPSRRRLWVSGLLLAGAVLLGACSSSSLAPIVPVTGRMTNLFFLHHSVGDGMVTTGNMRGAVTTYNAAHATSFVLWDHGYNADGLRNAGGTQTGTNYGVPDDNTDPVGLFGLWTGTEAAQVACRQRILSNHQVIAVKSCFPNCAIPDAATVAQYKTWYLAMRDVFDTRLDRLFVVVTSPPLHRLGTNPVEAANARLVADWLGSAEFLGGHPNVRCFDLFNLLARPADDATAPNTLRAEYEQDPAADESHPNDAGYQATGPALAAYLCEQAAAYEVPTR
ncbi:MAG: hypothetical protein HZB16_23830 [Armatimonadetes bacterium]|nr:hypothetical protein [Armatimonadota bacterium]